MRAADGREVGTGGLEVVVVAVDPRRGQGCCLVACEDAERARHPGGGRGVEGRDGCQDLLHDPVVGTAHRQDDAELGGADPLRCPGGVDHLLEVDEGLGSQRGPPVPGLRAEAAVLRAGPRLGREDRLELHTGAAALQPHAMGPGDERRHVAVRQLRHGQRFVEGDGIATGEHPLPELIQRKGGNHYTSSPHTDSRRRNAATSKLPPRRGTSQGSGSNAGGTMPRSTSRPARWGTTPASSSISPGLVASASPGSAGKPQSTTPAISRPRVLAASTVRAMWLSVPRPGRATITRGTCRAETRSAMSVESLKGTSRPPAPSTTTTSACPLRRRKSSTIRPGSSVVPSIRAATDGASGCRRAY